MSVAIQCTQDMSEEGLFVTHCVSIGCTTQRSSSTDREMEDIGECDNGRR